MVLGVLLGLSSSATNQQPPEAPLPPPMPRRHPPSPPSTPQDQAGVANQINQIQDRLAQYTPTGMAEKKIRRVMQLPPTCPKAAFPKSDFHRQPARRGG